MTGNLCPSAFVAAAFALHPIHVESVAWVSERKDVLSAFFWILTTWAYLRYVQRPAVTRYVLIIIFFVLGLLAKQMLVTLPFVLLLLDYWPLRRFILEDQSVCNSKQTIIAVSIKSCVLKKLPLFILSAIASLIVFLAQHGTGAMKSIIDYSLLCRVENALVAYVVYIGKMLWPLNLAIFYPHPGDKLHLWQTAGALLLLLSITVAVIWKFRQRPYLAVGWFWYLGTLLPVIGLVQVGNQAMADRYTYIPFTGLFIVIAWGIPDILGRLSYRKYIISLSATVLLFSLALLTYAQVKHWRTSMTLHKYAIQVVPNNWAAHHAVAIILYLKGDLNTAIKHYSETLRIEPEYIPARMKLAGALVEQNKLDSAIIHFAEVLRYQPDHFKARFNLGVILTKQGKSLQAVTHFRKALEIKPDFYEVHHALGTIFFQQGRLKEGIEHYTEAMRIQPDSSKVRDALAVAHNRFGIALARQAKLDGDVTHFTKALVIKPDLADAHSNLGRVLSLQGDINQALTHYSKALQFDPNLVNARYSMAGILAGQGKKNDAIKQYRKVLEINPNHAKSRHALQTLLKNTD
jgi:tetratricopeptide (TPR) repeat protein